MTFTNQQLIDQAREEVDFWRERDELIPSQQTAIRLRLAEIAMEALMSPEQEPVADVVAWSSPSEERTCDIRWRRHDVKPGPLYTAPPAPVVLDIGEIRVGRLPTMNQDDYPGLGDWWVQLRIGDNFDEVLARVYGATPQEANNRAQALACCAAMLQGKAEPRQAVRSEHAEWSRSTFGDVGPVGPLKHLSKEALEAAAEPGDLTEWADMQFLLWDAQRRAGITDEQITKAMIEKLAVNKERIWPEPKDGEPRLHIKAVPQQEDPQIKK